MDTKLLWPTHETEIPLTTPPKGRPNQKRPLSSPESTYTTIYTTVKPKEPKKKKTRKNLRADSSISDQDIAHYNTDDKNTNEVSRIHKIITGRTTLTKKDFKKN